MFLAVEIHFKNVCVTFQSTKNLKILQIILLFKYLCVQDSLKDQKLKHRLYFNFERCERRRTAMLGRSESEREMESAGTDTRLE